MKTITLMFLFAFAFFLFLLVGTGPAFTQFFLETNANFHVFDIASNYILSSGISPAKTEAKIPIPVTLPAPSGVTAGVLLSPNLFLGAEFACLLDISIMTGDFATEGAAGTIPNSASSMSMNYFRIGPICRYYFFTSPLRPFVGAVLYFAYLTFDARPPLNAKYDIGMIGADGMLGLSYDVTSNLVLSVTARTGYGQSEMNMHGTVSNVFFTGDKGQVWWEWAPVNVGLSLGYKF
jgi:hypothetical protein